jgi:hypothetical protein
MKHPWYIQIWDEGHNFDFWHVNHFIAGMLLVDVVILLKLELWLGFLISFVLMLAWEAFEIFMEIEETKFNMTFDVVFSTISFFLVYYWNEKFLSHREFLLQLYASLSMYVILQIWGYIAYRIRTRSHKEDRVGKKILHVMKTELER